MAKGRTLHFIVFFMLALTWGSSFILMKKGMEDDDQLPVFSAVQVAAFRLSMAALVLLPVAIKVLRKVRPADWKWLLAVAFLGSGFPAFLFTISETYLSSSVAGILNSLTPLFTLILGIAWFRKPSSPRQVVGLLIGLAGAVSLIGINGLGDSKNWSFSVLVVLATVFYGITVNIIGYRLSHMKPLHITSVSLLIVGIPCTFLAVFSGGFDVLKEHPHGTISFAYIIILAVLGTALAAAAYFWLAQNASVLFASSVAYVMQMVAVGWGMLDREVITWLHVLCGLIILTGVYLVNRGTGANQ